MKRVLIWASLALLLAGCSSTESGGNMQTPPQKQTSPTTAGTTTTATTTAPTAAPEAVEFQKVLVVDNEECVIRITDFREDPVWGWVLDAQLENKDDSDSYMFAISSASINGVQIEPLFASSVAPGKQAKEQIVLSDTSLNGQDIGLYSDIELHFRVYDAEDWTEDPVAEPSIHIYPYGAEKAQRYVRQAQPGDQVLAENDAVSVTVTGFTQDPIWGYTVQLFLVNKTDKSVMFTVEDASVNGFMADPLYAASVGPGNCAFSTMSWSDSTLEELEITKVEELEFTLRVYDEADWMAEDLLNTVVTLTPQQAQ